MRNWSYTNLTSICWLPRSTSAWTTSRCMGRRKRSRGRRRSAPARRESRASSRTSYRPSSSPPTTSLPWSSSAARRLSWRRGSGRRPRDTGSYILVPVFGKSPYLSHNSHIVKLQTCQNYLYSRLWRHQHGDFDLYL